MTLTNTTPFRHTAHALTLLCVIGLLLGTLRSQPTGEAAPGTCGHVQYLACDTRQKLNHDAANGIQQRLAAAPEGTGHVDIAETTPEDNVHADIA